MTFSANETGMFLIAKGSCNSRTSAPSFVMFSFRSFVTCFALDMLCWANLINVIVLILGVVICSGELHSGSS